MATQFNSKAAGVSTPYDPSTVPTPNTQIGLGNIPTTATDGWAMIPRCAGAPTGVPSADTGFAAIVFDTTNNKLWVYNPTGVPAWKGVVVA